MTIKIDLLTPLRAIERSAIALEELSTDSKASNKIRRSARIAYQSLKSASDRIAELRSAIDEQSK